MARRRSTFRWAVILGVLVLAFIGAMKVYSDYSEPVISKGEVVYEKAKKVKKVLEEPSKRKKR